MTETAPKGFWNAWKVCASARELIKFKGWDPAHAAAGAVNKEYVRAVEFAFEMKIPKVPDERKVTETLTDLLEDEERNYRQSSLPFPEDQIPRQPDHEKIAVLEARYPDGLLKDKSGQPISVNAVLRSPELRIDALKKFARRAATLKAAWTRANWELALFTNLIGSFERSVPPTKEEVDAFYAAREWERAKAILDDRDGPCCARCGTHKGKFEIHHKVPVRECWPLRLVQSNLEKLCTKCHHKEHHTNGFTRSGEDDFEIDQDGVIIERPAPHSHPINPAE